MADKKNNPYHDMAMLGREAAKGVRINNDKLHKRTHMTYDEFCEAVDKEIPAALFEMKDGMPFIPVRASAKLMAKALHGADPNYNYYESFINLIFE